jgi:hypothetical protein
MKRTTQIKNQEKTSKAQNQEGMLCSAYHNTGLQKKRKLIEMDLDMDIVVDSKMQPMNSREFNHNSH